MTWNVAAVITDSYMKLSDDKKEKQIVKMKNLTEEMKNEYVPFNCAAVIGAEDEFGRIIQSITGDTKSIKVAGVTMVGVMPIPWETVYAVGDNFTADDIFEVSTDGSVKKQGFAKIERIIVLFVDEKASETKQKKQLEELLNYGAEVSIFLGRPVKMAENGGNEYTPSMPYNGDSFSPAATQAAELHKAEDETDFFGAEYEAHLMKTAHSLYPTHRMYEANV